ncbi:unnamed protein product [Polarella glacialis]|uniref:Uncharacterized protein n=1 Tax=Polarella glacialis TaxID=89957 RepID=A0A813H8R1_POLGL|nr:unnamed protein product [Polarella glacialis]
MSYQQGQDPPPCLLLGCCGRCCCCCCCFFVGCLLLLWLLVLLLLLLTIFREFLTACFSTEAYGSLSRLHRHCVSVYFCLRLLCCWGWFGCLFAVVPRVLLSPR